MIRLHLVGFTPDHKGLVFSGRRGGRAGTYWIPVDDTFAKAILRLEEAREEAARAKAAAKAKPKAKAKGKGAGSRGTRLSLEDFMRAGTVPAVTDTQDLPLPPAPPRVESKLTPREIQQLLREGRTVKDVAARAGVDQEWVERFVGPVLHEMAGIIQLTMQAHQSRARLGESGLPVGEAVRRNLEDRKATLETIEATQTGWDARRLRARTWRVRLRFPHRGRRMSAEWEFKTDTRAVRPRNKLATELGWWPDGPGSGSRRPLVSLSQPPTPGAEHAAAEESRTDGKGAEPTRRRSPRAKRAGGTRRTGTTRARRPAKAKSTSKAKGKGTTTKAARGSTTRERPASGSKRKAKTIRSKGARGSSGSTTRRSR